MSGLGQIINKNIYIKQVNKMQCCFYCIYNKKSIEFFKYFFIEITQFQS